MPQDQDPNQDEAEKLRQEILYEVPNAEEWLISPNSWLSGQTPEQAIASGQLERVRQIVYSILYIGVS